MRTTVKTRTFSEQSPAISSSLTIVVRCRTCDKQLVANITLVGSDAIDYEGTCLCGQSFMIAANAPVLTFTFIDPDKPDLT